jgi:hypothetical protein
MSPVPRSSLVVSLSVVTEDEQAAVRASEVMARAAAGLALEGITVSLTIGTVIDDGEDDDS